MKFKAVTILLLSLCPGGLLFAQTPSANHKLYGSVADEVTGKPLAGASVQVQARPDNKVLGGAICDNKGDFKVENVPEHVVRVRISLMGYQTMVIDSVNAKDNSALGLVKLKQATIIMPDVVIKSLKPMVEYQVDRQVVNMDRVPGGTSGSVTQALKNTGTVDVDPTTNKITVRGQEVKLQMDGRPFQMSNDMLAQMPAAMLEQVEVILSPGAKESAEGGAYILNLVSKKNTMDNYNGSVSLSAGTNKMNYGGLNLNYKAGKVNVFGSFFGGMGKMQQRSESERQNYYSSVARELSEGNNDIKGFGGYFKLGFDYNYDDNNSFTFYGTYNKFDFNVDGSNSHLVQRRASVTGQAAGQYSYLNNNKNENKSNDYSLSGFYKRKLGGKGHEITFDAMYTQINSPSTSEMSAFYSYRPGAPFLQNTETGTDANTMILKTDYVLPISGSKLEAGYSFTYRYRENDYDVSNYSITSGAWLDSLGQSNLFKYREGIHAVYTSYSRSFGKLDVKAGLRAENLTTKGEQITSSENFSENFFNLFPTLNISYKLSNMLQLAFSTFRRVRYPMLYYVNPFKQYDNPTSYFAGNPKIKPFFINSYSLSLSQFVNTYYVYSTGMFTNASTIVQDSITANSYINLSNNKTYGVELTLPYYNSPMMPFRLPGFITMANIKYSYIYRKQTGSFVNEDLTYSDKSYNISANIGLKLWMGVESNIWFMYRPRVNTSYTKSNERKDLYVSLSKGFLNQKLKVTLSAMDLLKSQKYDNETYSTTYYSHSLFMPQNTRSVMLSLTYMFNDYKERRDRTIDDGRDASDKKAF